MFFFWRGAWLQRSLQMVEASTSRAGGCTTPVRPATNTHTLLQRCADFSSYFATQRSPEPSLHRARARAFGQHGGTLDTPGTPANRSGTSEDGVPPVHPAIEGAPLTAPTACAGVGGPAPVGVGDGLSSRMGPAPHAAAPATPAEHGALPPLPPSGRMLRSRSSPGSRGFNGGGMAGGMSAEPSAYAGAGGAPAHPTTSAFGSLPQPVAGGSSQLQRMLQVSTGMGWGGAGAAVRRYATVHLCSFVGTHSASWLCPALLSLGAAATACCSAQAQLQSEPCQLAATSSAAGHAFHCRRRRRT